MLLQDYVAISFTMNILNKRPIDLTIDIQHILGHIVIAVLPLCENIDGIFVG